MCVAKVLLAKRNTARFEVLRQQLSGYAIEHVADDSILAEQLERFEPDVLILGNGMRLPERINVARPPVVIGLDSAIRVPPGIDYLPCDFEAVPATVHQAFVDRHRIGGCPAMSLLSMDLDTTRDAAFSSMKTAGELGVVLGFFRQASLAADHAALARLVRQTALDFAVVPQIMIRTAEGWLHLGDEERPETFGRCSIMDRLKDKPRIFEAGGRTFVNYPNATVSWDSPADPVQAGSLRDLLAHIAEGASNQAAAIDSRQAIVRSRNVALDSSAALRGLMGKLEEDVQAHRAGFEDKLNDFLADLLHSFKSLPVSERDREGLTDLCRDSIERILDGFDRAEQDLDIIEQVIENLEKDMAAHADGERRESPPASQPVTLFS